MTVLWPSGFSPARVPNRNACICASKDVCKNVHRRAICESPNRKDLKRTSTEQQWEGTNHEYMDDINFRNMMLSKESQTQKNMYCIVPLTWSYKSQNQSVLFKVKRWAHFGGKRWSLEKGRERDSGTPPGCISPCVRSPGTQNMVGHNVKILQAMYLWFFTFFCIYASHQHKFLLKYTDF